MANMHALTGWWRALTSARPREPLYDWLVGPVEAMQLGVTITNFAGRILFTNPAEAQMHGYTVEELVGEDVRVFAAPDAAPRRSGEELQSATRWVREGWNMRRDGTRFPVRLLSDVLRDPKGEPVGIVTTCEDITERRRAEEALRESEAHYRAIVEHATYGICRIGPDRRFSAVNLALVAMLEYDSAENLLQVDASRDVFATPDWVAEVQGVAQRDGRIEDLETEWNRKDGTSVVVRLNGRALPATGTRVAEFVLIVEDVTVRRALEEQLRQSQKMEVVGQLTSGIAHDFNNILSVILANVDLLAESARSSAWIDGGQAVDDVRDAARRGAAMVRQLMAFSRREQPRLEPVDLGALAQEQVRVLRRILPEHIEIRVSVEDGLPAAKTDRRAVAQILLNLATNARDAMPQGGILQLTTVRTWLDKEFRASQGWGEPGEYVALFVGDTGVGMDAGTRKRVFEPFFTTKRTGEGTGLGMAMVYGLMKQHRGFVHVYSEVGEGTTVKLWFPVALPERSEAPTELQVDALPGGTEMILVAEDEAPLRRAARRALERHGYRVLAAADGEEAWELFQQHAEDVALVLTDLVMPRVGGRELRERIAASAHPVPVLFATGYSAQDIQTMSAVAADAPLLHKPWTLADLLLRVRELLGQDE